MAPAASSFMRPKVSCPSINKATVRSRALRRLVLHSSTRARTVASWKSLLRSVVTE